MLFAARLASMIFLVIIAVVGATLWAKLIGALLGGGGLIFFVIAPLPVLGGIALIGYWIDGYLARLARRRAREQHIYGRQYK